MHKISLLETHFSPPWYYNLFEAFSLDNLLFQVLEWAASILHGFPISLDEYQ